VAFATVLPRAHRTGPRPGAPITHVVFEGLDRYRSIVHVEDGLGDDVLIADRLDGRPLGGDHGAPVGLVSPGQYGFMSTKHLRRIELHTTEPAHRYHPSRKTQLWLDLVKPHPRARVWEEERHRYLPATLVPRCTTGWSRQSDPSAPAAAGPEARRPILSFSIAMRRGSHHVDGPAPTFGSCRLRPLQLDHAHPARRGRCRPR
jgi:DMSO/TMAO reductase YedYZ molybdopterin-dependent catalytic subunit